MARLTLLLPNLESGGAERVGLSLAEHFLARGHEVDVVLAEAKGDLVGHLPAGAELFDLRAKRFRSALRPLIHYLRQRRPAAIQASMWPLTSVAILAARLSGTRPRIILSDHSILSAQYGDSRSAMAALRLTTRLLYPLADARICVSEGCAGDLSEISGLPRDRFTVIYNPMLRPPAELATNPAVEQLWGGAEPRILTVGMLKPAKNHELLIRAFARIGGKPGAKLMIVGEGELRPSLERLVGEVGLNGRVVMPGLTSDPWPYYASADLFVLSSSREGFPGALVEAMAAGVPVVSTDCNSGPREILEGGKFGGLVPVGDTEALAEAMKRALGRPHDPSPARDRALSLSASSGDRYLEAMLGRASAGLACR